MSSSQQRHVVIPFLISLLKNEGTEDPWESSPRVSNNKRLKSLSIPWRRNAFQQQTRKETERNKRFQQFSLSHEPLHATFVSVIRKRRASSTNEFIAAVRPPREKQALPTTKAESTNSGMNQRFQQQAQTNASTNNVRSDDDDDDDNDTVRSRRR